MPLLQARRRPRACLCSQIFSAPLSTMVLPSRVTVLPGRYRVLAQGTVLSPPAHALLPAPTVTAPAGTQLPIVLLAGSVTLGLMPRSTKPNASLRGSVLASYAAL